VRPKTAQHCDRIGGLFQIVRLRTPGVIFRILVGQRQELGQKAQVIWQKL
jgi:hypothetical protein